MLWPATLSPCAPAVTLLPGVVGAARSVNQVVRGIRLNSRDCTINQVIDRWASSLTSSAARLGGLRCYYQQSRIGMTNREIETVASHVSAYFVALCISFRILFLVLVFHFIQLWVREKYFANVPSCRPGTAKHVSQLSLSLSLICSLGWLDPSGAGFAIA